MAMADESLERLIEALPAVLQMDVDQNLCTCNEVPKRDVIRAIAGGATSVMSVRKETGATLGIGCCTQQVQRLIDCMDSGKAG